MPRELATFCDRGETVHKVQDPFDQVYNDDKPSATLEKNRRFRGTKCALQVCHACDAEKSRHCLSMYSFVTRGRRDFAH